jgi:outer membrane receptor for ferrienterochelin and colicins
MNSLKQYSIFLFIFLGSIAVAQKPRTDANIFGHVVDLNGTHIPFVSISIEGTAIGTSTDITGHYKLINFPEGTWLLKARYIGYKPAEVEISIHTNETKEVNIILEEDQLQLEEVVITGNRNETKRSESTSIVNTITPQLFNSTQSVVLGEGLNFCPGLRMESNCQNCGFSQVRMNGMEGPYAQILINSRPIFSGLAGVYGLELIPATMIERVEVIRGGGSALYGSNAIAGTINLILKDPVVNAYELGLSAASTGVGIEGSGDPASDFTVHLNASVVAADNKSGMSLYGFYRNREPFDANGDGFSELPSLRNITIGSRIYHRFGTRAKLLADFFAISEKRRGGDKHDEVPHMAGIAEAVEHQLTTGALTYEMFFRDRDLLSVYASGQRVNRDSYYGANQSLSDYGSTRDLSYTAGVQYNAPLGIVRLVAGIETVGSGLIDKKLGYPDLDNAILNPGDSTLLMPVVETRTISDQTINTSGVFAQAEVELGRLKLSAGARYDHYTIENSAQEGYSDKTGNVASPRFNAKYDILESLQARVSYSQGYRAPQIFDEDLHIETSGARQVIHQNDPDLRQETSHSAMASLDFHKKIGTVHFSLLAEGFFTRLNDAFVNEYGEPDENGTVVYTRVNAENGAEVMGLNLEMNLVPAGSLTVKGGFTIQSSRYDDPQEFDERRFFRTPDEYGYLNIDWQPAKPLGISVSGNYTGRMLVPYFGPALEDPASGELRTSPAFFDTGWKVRYSVRLNGASLQIYAGMKNVFNSWQDDFDTGIDRDPGYVYGPMSPRTVYAGVVFGNVYR